MQKRHLTLAVVAALTAPAAAFAQTSNVEIYGRASLGLDNYSATGSTAGASADYKARNRIFDTASRIGFRGTENLGSGLKALFQIESGVNLNSGNSNGLNGLANGSTGLAARDSFVGIEGAMGRVTLGRQSIFYSNGAVAQTSSNYVNTEIPWTKGNVFGRVAGPAARTSNVIAYSTPTLSGFNGTLSYSPSTSETAQAGAKSDASITGVTMRYTGLLNLQWDYAVNQAASGGVNQLKITGNKIGIGWPYAKDAQISLIWTNNKNNDMAATPGFSGLHDNVSQNAWTLNWEHMFGNIQALAMLGKMNAASGCTGTALIGGANGCVGTDATGYMLGARYVLSKRSSTYLTYNKVTNGANQVSDYTNDGYTAAAATLSAGTDPRVIAVGLMHNF